MITIDKKEACSGCNACGDICAHKAITFETDPEGFSYPVVDKKACVNCGLCDRVCPMRNRLNRSRRENVEVYAAYSNDEYVRLDSTSGGMFSVLAQYFYNRQSYVGGAVFCSDFSVKQEVNEDAAQLPKLRSSKYLQSKSEGIYLKIRDILKGGHQVLYCGTPCQIAALHNFLGKEYDNLTTIDFLCHGVCSPKVFQKYMKNLEEKSGSKATEIKFKAKKWGWHNFSMRVAFSSGQEYCQDRHHDAYFVGYLRSGCFTRPSCYSCPFKRLPHDSDITLGDFWGIEKIDPSMDQDKGTSLVLLNTEKGRNVFSQAKPFIQYKPFTLEEILRANPNIEKNQIMNQDKRRSFFSDFDRLSFDELAKKHFFPKKNGRMKKLLKKIKRILSPSFWMVNKKVFHELFDYDIKFNASFAGQKTLSSKRLKRSNMRIIRIYRLCQAAKGTIWYDYYRRKLRKINRETGVALCDNLNIGKGLIIGHTGRIIINSKVEFSENLFLTHGVTIGRDIRGKRMGAPRFGKNVCVRCNSTIVGGITIGDDVLIAPNTFVNFDVPSHSVVIGNPATIHHKENATEGHLGFVE